MNRLLTTAELVADTQIVLEKSGFNKLFAEATPEKKEALLTDLANIFGAGFPTINRGS